MVITLKKQFLGINVFLQKCCRSNLNFFNFRPSSTMLFFIRYSQPYSFRNRSKSFLCFLLIQAHWIIWNLRVCMRFHNYFLPHCVLMCTPRGIFFRQLLSRQLFSHFLFGQQTVIEIHSEEFSFFFVNNFFKLYFFLVFPMILVTFFEQEL